MGVPIFEQLEKLIIEHGSAEILKQRVELAKDQYDAMERKLADATEKLTQLEIDKQSLTTEILTLRTRIIELEKNIPDQLNRRLEQVKEKILILLSKNANLTPTQIAFAENISIEVAKFHLEELKKRNLVIGSYNTMRESKWRLDQEGRRYLISNDLLQ